MDTASVAYPETTTAEGTRAKSLREVYVESVVERAAELGSPLSGVERLGYEVRAAELYPTDRGRS